MSDQRTLWGEIVEETPPRVTAPVGSVPYRQGSVYRALSLWQPWASLMAAGYKRIETRSWRPWLKPGDTVLIHAAKRWDPYEFKGLLTDPFFRRYLDLAERRGLWSNEHPPLGCLVAVAHFSEARRAGGDAMTVEIAWNKPCLRWFCDLCLDGDYEAYDHCYHCGRDVCPAHMAVATEHVTLCTECAVADEDRGDAR